MPMTAGTESDVGGEVWVLSAGRASYDLRIHPTNQIDASGRPKLSFGSLLPLSPEKTQIASLFFPAHSFLSLSKTRLSSRHR